MTHPATRVRGVTFVQKVGTPQETSHTKGSVPFLRRRVSPTATPETLAREFNLSQEETHAATLGARSIPFGGPIVILQDVAFTSGVELRLAHQLKSAKTFYLGLAHPYAVTAGSPIAYVATVNGAPLVDDANITLHPLGTFKASVILGLMP